MDNIQRKRFFDLYHDEFGRLNQAQVDGINQILCFIEADEQLTDIRHAAYMLATIKHECADRWTPIEEYGKGLGRTYGVPVDVKIGDKTVKRIYYGRGYVQLTWQRNYLRAGMEIGMHRELYYDPDLALQPDIAYRIMSHGMRVGLFTGKKLGDYILGQATDYRHARMVINGMDCADKIAGCADLFEQILRASACSE